jgi:hypothetical protein
MSPSGKKCESRQLQAILVPGSNPQNLDTFVLANLANFHVAAILAISTYKT